MIEKINLENILFLDIETVPEQATYSLLDDEMKQLWEGKTQYQRKDEFTPEAFYDRAGIWAEFGKIICISVGYFTFKSDIRHFRVTSFFGDEHKILQDFSNLLNNHFNGPQHLLCGHNAKEFDFPYIARRMLINGLKLPQALNIAGEEMKGFMLKQTRPTDIDFFLGLAGMGRTTVEGLPIRVVIPSFILSELRTAFQMGFLIFIPFIVIDFLVASILMAMGMMMMPPVVLSLPFKLLLFVLVDGWTLVVRSLVESFRL